MPELPELRELPELVRVGPDDWAEWRRVRLRALTADPDAFGSSLVRERDWSEEDWRRRLAARRERLVRVGGAAVATAGWYPSAPGRGEVVAMWVDPAFRGLGLGRRLLEAVLADLRAAGLTARLWVADGNGARSLYEAAGFVATGDRAPIRPGAAATKSLMEQVEPER